MNSKDRPIIISLGVNCEVRTVVKEWEALDGEFEDDSPNRHIRGNNFFDWNITNVWAIIKCLENDFSNVFRYENIVVREETDGKLNYIEDKGSTIYFHHTFSRSDNITDQATVDKEYDEKRIKVNYLVEKFKAVLNVDEKVTFVRRGDENLGETVTLLMAISSRRAGRPFMLIAVRNNHLEGDIPEPYASSFAQVVLPAGDWTAAYWAPVFALVTTTRAPRHGLDEMTS